MMERRRFLVGVGSAAAGGSTLIGSGAFSRVESQRQVTIDIAHDNDAYLGLERCSDKPNTSYVRFEDGHLVIDMSSDNPTTDDGNELGYGVNSDSISEFNDVFQICNNGKDQVYYWIEVDPVGNDEDYGDAVQFYFDGHPDTRVDNEDEPTSLPVGQCHCVGLSAVTKGLSEGDTLVEGDEIVIHAYTDG